MNKNILRFLLSSVLLMCCMTANAVGIQPSGEGTSANPYQIATKEHLLWFADYVNQGNLTACAILSADITVNNGVLDSNGDLNSGTFETWTPIGSWGSEPNTYKGFAGEFNGNGHTISGLYFNDETKAPVGLFGIADNNGYIHDVGVKDSYFRGKSHVAGICGDLAKGKIENCWNGATVIGTSGCAGGITGSCWHSSSVSGCHNIGNVSSADTDVCGGICGSVAKNNDESIYSVSNCVSLQGKCDRAYNIGEEGAKVIDVYILDASAFASGDVCWILNGQKIDTKWRQQIGTDSYPVWTGNYLVNYYNGSYSYYYNETMCEKSSNGIHNFEKITIIGCNGDTFYYWHCTHCGNDYSYEGDGGHKNQTKEWSPSSGAHSPEWVQAVLPTATTEGRYGHWHCRLCGKNFFDEQCTVEATDAALTVPVAKNNEIWYTTTDNKKLTPYRTDVFGAAYNDADNVYEKGLGKITFAGEVTSIGDEAFESYYYSPNCKPLQSIIIPNSVTSIGVYAFRKCTNLSYIKIPESITSIASNAFYLCNSLPVENNCRYVGSFLVGVADNTLSDYTIKEGTRCIGANAFENCSNMTSVTIPISVIDIGKYAFLECAKLGSVTLPEYLTGIGDYAFAQCSQLQSITIPGSVKSMGMYVFSDCTSLSNVTIEDGACIGQSSFASYKGAFTIKGSLSGVGENAFQGCSGLTSVSVKSGSIGNFAFEKCSSLSAVTLMDGVTHIGQYAFGSCPISQITIPGSVKSMGVSIFSNCTGLNTVTIGDGAYIGGNVFEKYAGTIVFKGGLSGAGGSAFAECNVLTAVSIASGSIGSYAFADCTNLSAVTFGEDVTAIGDHAFKGCTKLKSISIENGSIGEMAFSGCTELTTVTIKSGSIGNKAFDECNKLSTVTLQEGVTGIGEKAFNKCSQLQSIVIPGSVKSMGSEIFYSCDLKNVTISDGAYIGKWVFKNYQGTITLNGDLSGAGEFAFQGCPGLTSVSFESGNIGLNAFDGCENICTITLQKDVTGIDAEAFAGCVGLKDITVKWTEAKKIPAIPWEAFRNVDKSKVTLHIPSYTTALYQAKDVWNGFKLLEDVNVIITKTDGSTVEQKLKDGDEVTIDESEDDIKSLVVTEKLTNISVTYIRNFANADKWQGWYVPFDVDVADMAQAGLEVAKIYGILLDNSGNTVLAFLKMDTGTVKANTPYVVRPKESGKVTLTTETTIHPTVATSMFMMSIADTYTIGGIYEQTTTPGKWYAINKDGRFQKMGEGVGLRPFRVWMTIDSREDNPYATKSGMNMMVISKGQIYTVNGKNYLAQ